jgi:hypothetical protein
VGFRPDRRHAENTNYFFEAFVMNVCCAGPFPGNSPSILSSRSPD